MKNNKFKKVRIKNEDDFDFDYSLIDEKSYRNILI